MNAKLTDEQLYWIQRQEGILLLPPRNQARCPNEQYTVLFRGNLLGDVTAKALHFTERELREMIRRLKGQGASQPAAPPQGKPKKG